MSFLSDVFKGASNNFTQSGGDEFKDALKLGTTNYNQSNRNLDTLIAQLQQRAQPNAATDNLANQQLQNTTGQNVATQAALMAGQRGAGANPGLIARQIGQQGAGIQQQAVGQDAQMQLEQQLAKEQAAQQQLGAAIGTQGALANQYYGSAAKGIQANNEVGSNQAGQNAAGNRGLIGGLTNAVGGFLGFAQGGQVPGKSMPWANEGDWGFNFVSGNKPNDGYNSDVSQADKDSIAKLPVQQVKPMAIVPAMAKGGMVLPFTPMNYVQGGQVSAPTSAQHATVQGNSPKNDKIPAVLSEDEVVLPRSVTQSSNPPQMAAQFMAQVMAGKHRVRS